MIPIGSAAHQNCRVDVALLLLELSVTQLQLQSATNKDVTTLIHQNLLKS